jgi:arylsulfatase A-like enzyme
LVPEQGNGEERPLDDLVGEMLERPISRSTLLKRGRDLGLTLAASSFLTACASAAGSSSNHRHAHTSDAAAEPTPRHLVLIIIDAGRPDYLDYTEVPNIKSLMQRGTVYDRAWVGQLESVTPASHATIGSGCHPNNTGGILGFYWEDPKTHLPFNSVPLNGTDPSALSVIMADAKVPTMAEYLKRHDARAKIYAASGHKYFAADAAGGPHADFVSYYLGRDDTWGPLCLPGRELPASITSAPGMALPEKALIRLGVQDALVAKLALDVVREEMPRMVILNLPEMDYPVAHVDGGPLAPDAVATIMKGADQLVGDLIAEYERAGIIDDTVFMVIGDHGVIPLERFVDQYEVLRAMQQAGYVVSHDAHTGFFGWMEDLNLAPAAAASVEYARIPYVDYVYFMVENNGRRTYHPAPATADKIHPALDSAYRYLLQTFAGPNGPHVVCFYPERAGTLRPEWKVAWRGDHGGAQWGAQHIPFVIAGPGVKKGHTSHYPARLVDLAPTVMRLLGAPYPRTDGIVLADCMTQPIPTDVQAQTSTGRFLIPRATAVRRKSQLELAALPPMKHKPLPRQTVSQLARGAQY